MQSQLPKYRQRCLLIHYTQKAFDQSISPYHQRPGDGNIRTIATLTNSQQPQASHNGLLALLQASKNPHSQNGHSNKSTESPRRSVHSMCLFPTRTSQHHYRSKTYDERYERWDYPPHSKPTPSVPKAPSASPPAPETPKAAVPAPAPPKQKPEGDMTPDKWQEKALKQCLKQQRRAFERMLDQQERKQSQIKAAAAEPRAEVKPPAPAPAPPAQEPRHPHRYDPPFPPRDRRRSSTSSFSSRSQRAKDKIGAIYTYVREREKHQERKQLLGDIGGTVHRELHSYGERDWRPRYHGNGGDGGSPGVLYRGPRYGGNGDFGRRWADGW